MRYLLVLSIWIVIVGGLWTYTSQRDAAIENIDRLAPPDLTVSEKLVVEVTPTFSVEEDPFALRTTESDQPAALDLRLNGTSIAPDNARLGRGETIRLESVSGLLTGFNEIYVAASPPVAEAAVDHAIRVRVFQREQPLADQTIWAGQGAPVAGSVVFEYTPATEEDSHDR